MRRKSKVLRNIDFKRFQLSALSVFLLVSVLFISGCQKEKEEITRRPQPTPTPECTEIDPAPFRNQGTTTRLSTQEVCVSVGQCVGTQIGTENKIAQKYCESTQNSTCRPGRCNRGSCKAIYDVANSSSVHIQSCVAGAQGPPACGAREQLCKCTLVVTGRGELDCDCDCR